MKTPEQIFDERNWFATEEEMEIVTEMMIEYASQFQSKKEEQCCGSCKTFKYEDIDGCGICGISQFAKNCKEGTDCKLYKQLKKK